MGDYTDTGDSAALASMPTKGVYISTLTTPWGRVACAPCIRSLACVAGRSDGFALIAQNVDGTWWWIFETAYRLSQWWPLKRFSAVTSAERVLTSCGL